MLSESIDRAGRESSMPVSVSVQRVLDQAVAEGGIPGILAAVHDGADSFFGSAGVADTATGRERKPQDRFRIGSTTKAFTATIVLQLAADGALGLDDSVEQWLPETVIGHGHDGSKITVRNLLNHTSGIFNYSMDPALLSQYYSPAFLDHRYDSYRPDQLVQIAMSHPPVFAPGTSWQYSNTNFVLAGMIIERVTGTRLAEQIARRITDPLKLTGTYLPGDETTLGSPHGRHYSKLMLTGPDAEIHDVTDMSASTAWAAGGMISTAEDLNQFFRALLSGSLLPPTQKREMFTTVSTEGAGWIPNTRYGLGVFCQQLPCDVTAWGAGGAINGSWSYTMGTETGTRMLTSNVNADWVDDHWTDPIGIFTELLKTEFCPASP